MNKLISILLIAIITSFIWRDVVVYGVFKIQQDYISANQCINRNKPITQCNGNCVLTERLSAPIKGASNSESDPILIDIKMEYFFEEEESTPSVINETERQDIDYLKFRKLKGFLPSQIKPPELV